MATEKRGVLLNQIAPLIAADLARSEFRALRRSDSFKEQSETIVRRRPVRSVVLYGSWAVASLLAMAAGIVAGVWLVGLPMHPGEGLAKEFPLSFMIPPGADPWMRYLWFVGTSGVGSLLLVPFGLLRYRIAASWAAADSAKSE